jgi:hypothetical protein
MPLLTKVEETIDERTFLISDKTRIAFVLEPQDTDFLKRKVYALESPPFKVRVRCGRVGYSEASYRLEVPWCYFLAIEYRDDIDPGNTSMWFARRKLDTIAGRVAMPPCLNILKHGRICHGNGNVAQSGSIENRLRQYFHHFWGSRFTSSTSGMKLIPNGFQRKLIWEDPTNIFAEWQRMNSEGKKIGWRGYRSHWRSHTIKTLEDAMKFMTRGY